MKQNKYSNLATYDSYKRNQKLFILGVTASLLIIFGAIIYRWWLINQRYNSIKSIQLTVNSGPVAPEFQFSKSLTITATGCTFQVVSNNIADNQNCNLAESGFKKIIDSYFQNNVQDSIAANNSAGDQNLIGGPQKKIIITKSDGTSAQTTVSADFVKNIQPFLNTVSTNVSQYSLLNY